MDENIQKWINIQTHTNIVTAFDSFMHDGMQFQLTDDTNQGNMYDHIKSLTLDLSMTIPRSYIETIYDCIIQLAQGLEFAHESGLVHGQFDLSKVMLAKDSDQMIYKISDFQPTTSLNLPISSEASYWPFSKSRKLTESEKIEVLMLKDIYSLGICVLELMIGRFSHNNYSISLDSLPLTWAEYKESTPLIQVLVECIQLDTITQRKGKLNKIKKLLIKDFKRFFNKPFYKMDNPFIGK